MARILDLTSDVGAYGTRLLAELGHDVVRVESPKGDALRCLGPSLRDATDCESGAFHQFLNAGKSSVALDLGTQVGRDLLLKLAATFDAVVASLPLPLDEDALLAAKPDLVLVLLDDGPPELCALARSGLLAITGEPDGKPTMLGGHVAHAAVGTYVALATEAALLSDEGQIVDISATQCLATLGEQIWVEYSMSGESLERQGSRGGITALAGALPCADGHWMVSVPPDPRSWDSFVKLVPDPAFKDDGSLADEAMRRERKGEILDRVAVWSEGRKKAEIVEEAQRLHVPATVVTTPLELIDDPQLIARGFLRAAEHPDFGRFNFPIGALAAMRRQDMGFAPRLGEHTAALLAEIGCSVAEIARWRDEGVVKA